MVNHEDRAYRYTVPRNNSPGFFLKRTLSLSFSPFRAPRRDHRQLRFTLDEPRTCQINGTGSHVNYERKPRRIVSETTARHRDTRASAYRFGDREYRDLNKLSPSLSLSAQVNYPCRPWKGKLKLAPSVLRLDASSNRGRISRANSITYAQFHRGKHTFLPYSGHRSRFALSPSNDRGHRVPVALIGAINFPPLDRQFN